jgi:Glycosyl hydrolase catalytic core/Beta-galactosidase
VNVLARHPISRLAALAVATGVLWLAVATGVLWLAVATTASAASAVPRVPSGFVGVNVDGTLADGTLADGRPSLPPAMSTMVGTGVESVRAAFSWAAAQPTEGGPYDFSQTDTIVGDAAQDGLTVLPVAIYTPSWDARPNPPGTIAIPRDDAPYAAYLSALVKRYGPNGTYWADNPTLPKRPIREWQIWNEPNFTFYWPARPFAPSYVALVKAAHTAIKRADPGAKVVLAGMPNDAWDYLQKIYDVPHAGRYFDVVAAHPYTVIPSNVILFLQKMRAVMQRNGDARKPIVITEMGWNSSIGHRPADNFCCQSTAARQAAKVKAVLPLLAQNRAALKLQGFYYYTWASQGSNGGPSANWAGIFQITGSRLVPKPVYAQFKAGVLALEHCRRIGRLAGRCAARAG